MVCKSNLSDKINEPISNCSRCKGSLCQDCSRSHNSEFPRHKLDYKMYIPKIISGKDKITDNEKKEFPKEKYFYKF